jgi:hypothetical protein
VQNLIVLQQLLPLLRFDGYYVLSDLTGVPDILSRIKPIFRSLVRGRRREPRVAELKPWVRFVVTAYLLVLVPLLALMIGWILMSAPRTFATAYDSLGLQLDRLRGSHGAAELGVGVFRIAGLVLPLAAMSLSVSRSSRMALRGVANWSRGSIVRRAVAVTGVAAVAAATAFVWWPDGDYEPIRPGEKGTLVEAVRSVPQIPSGRPSFTPQQAAVYATVQTERQRQAAAGVGHDADRPAPVTGAEPTPFEDDAGGEEDPASETDPGFDYPGGAEEPSASPTPSGGDTTPSGTAPAPTAEPTPTGTTDPAPSATATPTPSATATPSPSATATPTPTTTTDTATPDPTALASPSPVPSTETLDATTTPIPTP